MRTCRGCTFRKTEASHACHTGPLLEAIQSIRAPEWGGACGASQPAACARRRRRAPLQHRRPLRRRPRDNRRRRGWGRGRGQRLRRLLGLVRSQQAPGGPVGHLWSGQLSSPSAVFHAIVAALPAPALVLIPPPSPRRSPCLAQLPPPPPPPRPRRRPHTEHASGTNHPRSHHLVLVALTLHSPDTSPESSS